MSQPQHEQADEQRAGLLAAASRPVTAEDLARIRREIREARETAPERHAAIRAQLGLQDRPRRTV